MQILEWEGTAEPPRSSSYEVSETLSGALQDHQIPGTLRSILAPLEMRAHEPPFDSMRVHLWISAAGFAEWTRDLYVSALDEVAHELLGGRIKVAGAANDAVSSAGIPCGCRHHRRHRLQRLGPERRRGPVSVWRPRVGGVRLRKRLLDRLASDPRSAYRDLEDGTRSVLLQRLREGYGVRTGDDRALIHRLRELGVGDENVKKEVARFAADVCHASERGDADAQKIIESEAEELADVTASALRRAVSERAAQGGDQGHPVRQPHCQSLLQGQLERRSWR